MLKSIIRSRLAWGIALSGLGLTLLSTDSHRLWEISRNMEIFADVYKTVNQEYVDKTDANQLMRTALDTLLDDLDPYTNFFSEAQMEQLRIDVVGGWDGVGVETMERDGQIVVREVIEDSPAMKDGIRVGDVISEVDGNLTKGRKPEEVDKILNGKAGTKVRVKTLRPSTQAARDLQLTREQVTRKNVPYFGMLNDNETGYIVLTTFTERAGQNVADAFKTLQEDHKPKQLILDLRENGGGLLVEAVNICNIFLPKNKIIVSTRNKVKEWDRPFPTTNNPVDLNIPLIILMNEHSASASEIVAGALQDFDRAVLAGRKSFGKGLVQNTKDVGYNSKVKLTTAKYYIPSGRCIQALEYKDGTTVEIPDSMKNAYKTANGRIVYDGGGLVPDFKIDATPESAIAKALRAKYYFTDFANAYRSQHDSIAAAKSFKLTDKDFDDFVAFVKKQNYAFQLESEKIANQLEAQTKRDGTHASIQSNLQNIQRNLQQIKEKDILKNKEEITRLLEVEIVGRYYYEKGRAEMRLRHDADVREAIKLFQDKDKFKKLLLP